MSTNLNKYLFRFLLGLFSILIVNGCDLRTNKSYLNEIERLETEEKYEESIKLLDKYIEKNPYTIDGYLSRGADKAALGMFTDAIEDYKEVLVEDRFNEIALYNIGNNYQKLEQYKESIEYFEKLVEKKEGNIIMLNDKYNINFPDMYYGLGFSLMKLDDLDSSLLYFNKCLEYDYEKIECKNYIEYIYSLKNKKK
jgi:tetratricopeptide (TPR) repeat protein